MVNVGSIFHDFEFEKMDLSLENLKELLWQEMLYFHPEASFEEELRHQQDRQPSYGMSSADSALGIEQQQHMYLLQQQEQLHLQQQQQYQMQQQEQQLQEQFQFQQQLQQQFQQPQSGFYDTQRSNVPSYFQ
jgi:hypothetical protein